MRRILLAIVWSVLVVVASVAAPTASAQSGVFAGTWTSTDTDGSSQELMIRGSGQGSYAVVLVDDAASVCDGVPAMFTGSGVATDDTLAVAGALTCLPGGNPFRGRIGFGFEYSSETDTLSDVTGVTWYRS
ncbi:MAG TPA: hypothetical protein VFI44_08695 [Ornithinibacter sp.]|nr:hypothetical protein [Ornithinibacter sp.]